MGWLKLRNQSAANQSQTGRLTKLSSTSDKALPKSDHVEDIDFPPITQPKLQYPFQSPSISDSHLPYIDKPILSHISKQWQSQPEEPSDASRAWIVIDNIIFDCTEFQHEHPGGANVIQSFVGQDCTWQFWRFHSLKHMQGFGRKLRVGRTSGVENSLQRAPAICWTE